MSCVTVYASVSTPSITSDQQWCTVSCEARVCLGLLTVWVGEGTSKLVIATQCCHKLFSQWISSCRKSPKEARRIYIVIICNMQHCRGFQEFVFTSVAPVSNQSKEFYFLVTTGIYSIAVLVDEETQLYQPPFKDYRLTEAEVDPLVPAVPTQSCSTFCSFITVLQKKWKSFTSTCDPDFHPNWVIFFHPPSCFFEYNVIRFAHSWEQLWLESVTCTNTPTNTH